MAFVIMLTYLLFDLIFSFFTILGGMIVFVGIVYLIIKYVIPKLADKTSDKIIETSIIDKIIEVSTNIDKALALMKNIVLWFLVKDHLIKVIGWSVITISLIWYWDNQYY